jgi:hypothetical protein
VLLDERAHAADELEHALDPPSLVDADALRRELYRVGSTHPDAEVRARFLARYPTEAQLDRWAFKEFLALNPAAEVLGIDALPPLSGAPTVRELMANSARGPDDDKRNQERFAYDPDRKVRKDPWDNPLPADPAQLHMGNLKGLSSQGHAHYGLPRLAFSDSPDVLKKDPRRFAYPPTAKAFAADFAQEHTDLAILAATLGRPGGAALGWIYLGHAHHYIQDVANQIHTLQAIYPFFFDAKLQSYKEELLSLGGLIRSRKDFVGIGIDIIGNHHVLAENLFAKRVAEALAGGPTPAGIADALAAIGRGDGGLEQALDARRIGPDDPFGRLIAEEVIEASSREGGEVYELVRDLVKRRYSKAGITFTDGADPDAALRKELDQEKLDRFYRLQAAGFARAGSALRRHVRLFESAVESARASEDARVARFNATAQRLITTQLAYLDERDARLASFVPKAPPSHRINWLVPLGLLLFLMLVAMLAVWRVRRRRARRAAMA